MKVNVEREIDVERLLINLNEKSKCNSVGMAGYDVTVSKQMLRDAHDVIKQLLEEEMHRVKITQKLYTENIDGKDYIIKEKFVHRCPKCNCKIEQYEEEIPKLNIEPVGSDIIHETFWSRCFKR